MLVITGNASGETTGELASIAHSLEQRESAAAWASVSEFLERNAKWTAAAEARKQQIAKLVEMGTLRANAEQRRARLLLVRDQLSAANPAAAASALRAFVTVSRAVLWLESEIALARGDPDAAEKALNNAGARTAEARDAVDAATLYCADDLTADDVDVLLRARIAFARGDLAGARELAQSIGARSPSLADAHVLASNELDALDLP
jgi:hypothetical protein